MRFQLPILPFDLDALEPHISSRTLEFHYGKHHRNYVDKTNQLLEAPTAWQDELTLEEIVQTSSGPLFNNAAQAWNHTFFWHCLAPDAGGEPTGPVLDAITESFGSFGHFKQLFSDKAISVFGSGWAWLIKDRTDRLSIVTTANGDTPIIGDDVPLLTLDVWEHAYYLDYQNQRAKFVDAFWSLVNWEFVAENLKLDSAPNMSRLMMGAMSAPSMEAPSSRPHA